MAVDSAALERDLSCADRCMRERPASAGAEGATAPETLRQKDRVQTALWKAAAALAAHRWGRPLFRAKSLRFRDRGGAEPRKRNAFLSGMNR